MERSMLIEPTIRFKQVENPDDFFNEGHSLKKQSNTGVLQKKKKYIQVSSITQARS